MRPAKTALVLTMTPNKSGGSMTTRNRWISVLVMLTPQKQDNQDYKNVKQVHLNPPLLKDAEAGSKARQQTSRRHDRAFERGVSHLAVKMRRTGEEARRLLLVHSWLQRPAEELDQHLRE